ncbi:MarR family transcriptional regulator [Sphingomonas sp. AP4-R1]|jgi:sporulation-control protein spo0M|uniref:MarR family transcriptional regulator n=1 Tax=Sphingomonas sp. AP4-R1 TaxID=2735134 RepID=UPI00149366AF|nr:MarR family transcriptional regulator [Sphingomonas sp. AP4-R1]QJU59341.1 MarR family transcriptional regulator [Sphingomonas sp. AP4-R1]
MDQPADRRVDACRALIAERALVGQHVGFDICPCPVWDVLLDLYLAHHEQRPTYLWSLCVAANIPVSSAHRKINMLVELGLLHRALDTTDARRVTVTMMPAVHSIMDELLDSAADL